MLALTENNKCVLNQLTRTSL